MPAGSAPEPRGLLVEFLARCYRPASGKFVLIAAALLFIPLVGLMSRTSRAPRLVPGLTFLVYTNKPFTVVAALVLVTNGSHEPLEILPLTRSANVLETSGEYFHVPGYTSPWPEGLPRLVQPGQTTMLDIHLNSDFREPWWTEVAIFHGVDGTCPSLASVSRAVTAAMGKGGETSSLPVEEARAKMGLAADALPQARDRCQNDRSAERADSCRRSNRLGRR